MRRIAARIYFAVIVILSAIKIVLALLFKR